MSAPAQPAAAAAGQRRVLFVDDDVPFLETVRELMSVMSEGRWEVLTAESASRAFGLLQERAVDLVVVDVQMGVMDGIQMLSLLNRGYPNVQKVVLTGFANEKYRAACLSNGADLFLEKPTTPAGWQSLHAVLNELIKTRPEEGFRGVLRRVGLQDVIQMECLARSSSVLEVANRAVSGKIFIATGQIVHAQAGETTGEAAFNQLMSLGGGHFNMRPFTEPPARTISGQWEFLLMEAARKSDEAREQLAAHPTTEADAAVQAEIERAITFVPEPASAPEPGAATRPKIDEMLVCSGQGNVLYQWQCRNADVWVNFFEFLSQRGARLAQTLPLGEFDRLEVESDGVRAVVIIGEDRGVMVKSRREPVTG
jgi:CheY-like chemotaxis protein